MSITDGNFRHGAAIILMKPYDSGVMADIGALSVEAAVEFNYEAEKLYDEVQRHTAPGKVYIHAESGILKLKVKEVNLDENLARYLGYQTSDITDNSGDSPKNKELYVGGLRELPYWQIDVKAPQTHAASPLYDYIHILRAVAGDKDTLSFMLDFHRKQHREPDVVFECLSDWDHATEPGALFSYEEEYTT